jgi:hypothetical protein
MQVALKYLCNKRGKRRRRSMHFAAQTLQAVMRELKAKDQEEGTAVCQKTATEMVLDQRSFLMRMGELVRLHFLSSRALCLPVSPQ